MFYAVSALALKNNFPTSNHGQLIGWFNGEFVKGRVVDTRYGKILNRTFEMRSKADYDDFAEYEIDEVLKLFEEMKDFISEIHGIIMK